MRKYRKIFYRLNHWFVISWEWSNFGIGFRMQYYGMSLIRHTSRQYHLDLGFLHFKIEDDNY